MDEIRHSTPEKLDASMSSVMPEQVFRFITFEGDDFREQRVTILSFNFIPERVFVVVSKDQDIEMAIREVTKLNPGVVWERVETGFIEKDDAEQHRITQELKILDIPMRVNADGLFIHK